MKDIISDAQLVEFLRRSYFVVDGLWFVNTEERHGFDEAMSLDEAIWDVMSKIQARKSRALLGIEGSSPADLARAFSMKLTAEGYTFDIAEEGDQVRLTVSVCPWYEVLKSSGRTSIAETIANRICKREFAGWTREFPGLEFRILSRLCVPADGCQTCEMSIAISDGGESPHIRE